MAAYNKHNVFTKNLIGGVHNFDTHTFMVMLTNTAPTAANSIYSDLTAGEVANGNGYTTGGTASAITTSTSGGVAKATAADVVFTASGAVGPFRYADFYNITPSSPLKPLISWFDYGSSISLATGETFTVDFDGTNGVLTVT
jgi:hypothetical protein